MANHDNHRDCDRCGAYYFTMGQFASATHCATCWDDVMRERRAAQIESQRRACIAEDARNLAAIVKNWSWNCSPEECREQIRHTGFTNAQVAGEMIRQGYPRSAVVAVTGAEAGRCPTCERSWL